MASSSHYLSLSELLRRGWTPASVEKLLGVPDRLQKNPVNPRFAKVKLYNRARVERAEARRLEVASAGPVEASGSPPFPASLEEAAERFSGRPGLESEPYALTAFLWGWWASRGENRTGALSAIASSFPALAEAVARMEAEARPEPVKVDASLFDGD